MNGGVTGLGFMPNQLITIKCPQLQDTVRGLKQLGTNAPKAIGRAMRGWGEITRTVAVRITPKDLGALRNSIFVKQDEDGSTQRITIGAGGGSAPYAVHVHENLKSTVKWKTPGTGPKYIERPVRERMPKLDGDISRELDKELAKMKR